jgi:hypothetical protein
MQQEMPQIQSTLTDNLKYFSESIKNLVANLKLQKLDAQCVVYSDQENDIPFKVNYS